MTDDMVAFIRARLDEDRAAADEMQENANWMSDCGQPHNVSISLRSGWEMDSARVLRGVEAKRKLISREHPLCECGDPDNQPTDPRSGRPLEHHYDCVVEFTAGILASEWSTHPDYRSEWTP